MVRGVKKTCAKLQLAMAPAHGVCVKNDVCVYAVRLTATVYNIYKSMATT